MGSVSRAKTPACLAAFLFLPAALAGEVPPTPDPAVTLKEIDAARLDPASAVSVGGLQFRVGPATIVFEEGTVVAAMPVAGRPRELVFVGSGRFLYDPDDPVEAEQLKLFARKPALDEPFQTAILCGLSAAATTRLMAGDPPSDAASTRRAEESFAAWLRGAERRRVGVREDLFREAVGDARMETWFAAWFERARGGSFLYRVDPEALDGAIVGQFVRVELTDRERWRWERALREDVRAGRYSALDFDLLGHWNTWSAVALRDPGGGVQRGRPAHVARHYQLEVEIDREGEQVRGKARIDVAVEEDGARTLVLLLHEDLHVSSVRSGEGAPLYFLESGGVLVVVLPGTAESGTALALEVDYAGTLFDRRSKRVFVNWASDYWYPRLLAEVPATYDVTLRWPARLDVVASGVRKDFGDWEGGRWERRVLESPGMAFGIEVGDFVEFSDHDGRIAVRTAFDQDSQKWMTKKEQEDFRANVRDALAYFEATFGPYPLDHLSVVTNRQGYGQGMPGFVTIPDTLVALAEDYRQFLAHELAHQWWGNLVRPASPRDDWLSEAMAEYASLLYDRNVLARREKRKLRSPFAGWKEQLFAETKAFRSVERIGPVGLGARLNSSLCYDCYDRIVYTKGGMVVEMLGQYLGEEKFLPILAGILRNRAGKQLSADAFFAEVGRQAGEDLTWFRRRYVDGTGLPTVFYGYEIAETGPQSWQVKLTLEQEPSYGRIFEFVEVAPGVLDARSERVDYFDVEDSNLPLQVAIGVFRERVAADLGRPPTEREERDGNWILTGSRRVNTERAEFSVNVGERPLSVRLDPERTTLADFICQSCRPKDILRLRAMREIDAGHYEEARRFLEQALEAPLDTRNAPENAGERLVFNREVRDSNAAIYFNLSRIATDQGRIDEARVLLAKGREIIASDAAQWVRDLGNNQEARLLLRERQPKQARDLLWREVVNGKNDTIEGWMLAGIAAKAVGDAQTLDKALKFCARRGIDAPLLESR
ncbi:MAG: hypothetical protein MUE47_06540 [Acidobacteria bacterium]|nr:hypothetical protein [Acidobacteriota bacterium]